MNFNQPMIPNIMPGAQEKVVTAGMQKVVSDFVEDRVISDTTLNILRRFGIEILPSGNEYVVKVNTADAERTEQHVSLGAAVSGAFDALVVEVSRLLEREQEEDTDAGQEKAEKSDTSVR